MAIQRVTAKESVIHYIEEYITSNSLEPGMSLPSEEDLSKELKVSRNIIREGLQYFKTLGIIGSKPKTGAYIKQLFPVNPFGGYMPFIRKNKKRIKEIGQMRMIIELGIIPRLIEKISKDELKKLEEIAKSMFEMTGKQECLVLEFAFHGLLLDIVDNEIVSGLKPLLVEFFEEFNVSSKTISKDKRLIVAQEHVDIVNALKSKNEKKLIILIKAHYKSYSKN